MKYTTQTFIAKANLIHGEKYTYEKLKYTGAAGKVCITCPVHGDFWQRACSHIQGDGCVHCYHESLQDSTEEFIRKARLVHKNAYDYSETRFVASREKVTIKCNNCGSIFLQRASAHLLGQGCPICAKGVQRETLDGFLEKAKHAHGKKYSYKLVDTYQNNRAKVAVLCKTCGSEFNVTPKNHTVNKTGCPNCAVKSSEVELRLARWLERLGLRVELRNRKLLHGLEVDIYVPSARVGIEINGLYWHNSELKGTMYHQQKSMLAYNNGFTLYHFWEHQLLTKLPIVKSMLLAKLGLAKRIFARNTEVQEITTAEAREFLSTHHLDGAGKCHFAVGLFIDASLVGVLTLVKPRFNKTYGLEISRMAFALNTVVIGGASKMFEFCKRALKPESVISYASIDHGTGEVYTRMGFTWKRYTQPNYVWVLSRKKVLTRYQTQKHKLEKLLGPSFNPNMTESQNMQRLGFYKVYNSGNAVYVWDSSVVNTTIKHKE